MNLGYTKAANPLRLPACVRCSVSSSGDLDCSRLCEHVAAQVQHAIPTGVETDIDRFATDLDADDGKRLKELQL